MSTGNNEPGKLCLVVRQDVHLARKYSENVRGGTLFVTTAHREDGKQRKVYALFVIPIGRLILIPTGRRPMVTFRPILFVIPTDRREWRNLLENSAEPRLRATPSARDDMSGASLRIIRHYYSSKNCPCIQ